MRIYYLWASTYESVELMEKHHESDYALELLSRRVSDPFHVLAESPQDANIGAVIASARNNAIHLLVFISVCLLSIFRSFIKVI